MPIQTTKTADDLMEQFYTVLNALQGVASLGCGPQELQAENCSTPGYQFGKIAALIAERLADGLGDLMDFFESHRLRA